MVEDRNLSTEVAQAEKVLEGPKYTGQHMDIKERESGKMSGSTSKPIVIVDYSEVRKGKLEELKTAMNELVEFVAVNEPRMIAHNIYLNEDGTRMTVFQVHPDSASAEFHMKVAGSAFPKFVEFIRMSGVDIYGKPSPDLLERMRLKAQMLGSGTVVVHEPQAGFSRFGVPVPDAPE